MGKVLGSLVDMVLSFVFTFGVGSVVVTEAYNFMRKESLTRVHRGLGSMRSFTEQLTCLRYDNNLNATRIHTGSCKGYWKREVMRKARIRASLNRNAGN